MASACPERGGTASVLNSRRNDREQGESSAGRRSSYPPKAAFLVEACPTVMVTISSGSTHASKRCKSNAASTHGTTRMNRHGFDAVSF